MPRTVQRSKPCRCGRAFTQALLQLSGQRCFHRRPLINPRLKPRQRRPLIQINGKQRSPCGSPNEEGVSLAELAEQPFILATGGCSTNARSLATDAGLQLLDVRAEVREWSSAFTLVRENIGVTLVPEMTLPSHRQGLRVVPVKPRIDREFALVVPANKPPSAAVQALMSLLVGK